MFIKFFPSGPLDTNVVLVACPETREAAIFDAPFGSLSFLEEEIEKYSLLPKMILLTHSHWDHIGDLFLIKNKFSVPIYVHQEDRQNVEHPGVDGLPLAMPVEATEVDYELSDQQVLKLGSLEIKALHTPGHTPGGVCFFFPKEKVLISGDTLFRGTIGNLNFKTGRPRLMSSSLEKLLKLPKETLVIPGHGETTTIDQEQIQMRRFIR